MVAEPPTVMGTPDQDSNPRPTPGIFSRLHPDFPFFSNRNYFKSEFMNPSVETGVFGCGTVKPPVFEDPSDVLKKTSDQISELQQRVFKIESGTTTIPTSWWTSCPS